MDAAVYYTPQIDALVQAWKALPRDNLVAERKAFLSEQIRSTAAIREVNDDKIRNVCYRVIDSSIPDHTCPREMVSRHQDHEK